MKTIQVAKLGGVIGRNIRAGVIPGGFSTMFRGTSREPDTRRDRLRLGEAHKAIKEAADDVLLGRQMVRAEESQP